MTERWNSATLFGRLKRSSWGSVLSAQSIEALICTGSPGLYRVVVFFAVQHIYSLAALGRMASSMSIAQMAGFFTAIGWATLILVRVPGAEDRHAAVASFYRVVWMSFVTTVACTVLAIAIHLATSADFELSSFLYLLWGWTGYQITRHYFVALKRYRIAILYDVALIVGSCVVLAFFRTIGFSSSAALAVVLGAIACGMLLTIGRPVIRVQPKYLDVEGLQFGLTNFLSGGISLIFVPAAKVMCGPVFAGMLSLLSSVTALGMLLPRAISMMQLAELAKRKAALLSLDDSLGMMRRSIGWCNGLMFAMNVILVGMLASSSIHQVDRVAVTIAGLLLAVQCAVSMMGIANSSVMMVFEQGAMTARINVVTTAAFGLLATAFYAYGKEAGFSLIICSAIGAVVWRNWLIARRARDTYREYVDRHGIESTFSVKSNLRPVAEGAR